MLDQHLSETFGIRDIIHEDRDQTGCVSQREAH